MSRLDDHVEAWKEFRPFLIIAMIIIAMCYFFSNHSVSSLHSGDVSSGLSKDGREKSSCGIMSFYLAPNGKPYPSEADYKASLRCDTVFLGDNIVFTPDHSKEYASYYKTVMLSPCLVLGGVTLNINQNQPQKLEDWMKK